MYVIGMTSQKDGNASLYRSLGIDPNKEDVLKLTEKELARAYRKAALKWHPDKNRGNPFAAKRFTQIFLAYETLSDPEKRKSYDHNIQAERLRRKRFQQLDSARKRLREDLELRENATEASASIDNNIDPDTMNRIQAELERLRNQVVEEFDTTKTAFATKSVSKKDDLISAGDWEQVEDYKAFRESPPVRFESFEQAVLSGKPPFS